MRFLIVQTHSSEACPVDDGGPETLFENPDNIEGLEVIAAYGAYPEHKLYYIVETDDYSNIEKFLLPGRKKCRVKVTPVDQFI